MSDDELQKVITKLPLRRHQNWKEMTGKRYRWIKVISGVFVRSEWLAVTYRRYCAVKWPSFDIFSQAELANCISEWMGHFRPVGSVVRGRVQHTSPLRSLSRLVVKASPHTTARADFKILLLTFKSLKGLAPLYLSELLLSYSPARWSPLCWCWSVGYSVHRKISRSESVCLSF